MFDHDPARETILAVTSSSSTPQIREFRIDPRLNELVEPGCFVHNFLSFGFCRNVRACVVDHVALAATCLEVVGVLVGTRTECELDAVERKLMMPVLAVTR
jgi:hypothetical protein